MYFHGSGFRRACRVSRVTGIHSPGGNEATYSLGQVKPWSLCGYEASKVFNLLKGILIRFQRYPERYNLGETVVDYRMSEVPAVELNLPRRNYM